MTEQEKINAEVQMKLAMQDAKFAIFMEELKQQREDIRRLNEKHEADRKALEAKHDADMKAIDSKFDRLSEQIHTMTIAAVVGFGAIAVAIAGLVVATLK